MLYIEPTTDTKIITDLTAECGLPSHRFKVAFVLLEDGAHRGVAFATVGEVSVLESVGIIPAWRGRGYGDFLTRTMMFKLSEVSETIEIGYQNRYFDKFGFVNKAGRLTVKSQDLKFPSDCHK